MRRCLGHVRDAATFGARAAAHEHAAEKNRNRYDRRGHEKKHQLLAVQLDFVKAVVLSLGSHNHRNFSTLARVEPGQKLPGRG